MTAQPFRFIHAADLHIELPVNGLLESPSHLEDRILDAPRLAAERMFRFAAEEKVDFVVLSGDIIDPQITGPWGLLFLIDEFKKLEAEHIPVYWAGGKADSPENIPAAFQFPSNVHIFSVGKAEEFFFQKDGVPIARILGTSAGRQTMSFRPPELTHDSEGIYTICAFHGKVLPESVRGDGIQYWALGGGHRREFLMKNPVIIHYPGVNLARSPEETGDYGFSLVEVNEFGRAKVDLVKTSPLRWQTERLAIRDEMSEEQILSEMRARIKNLRDVQDDVICLLSWRIEGSNNLYQELRYGNLAQSLLRDLRADFGREDPILYCVDIKPILPDMFASEYYDQQTILGDYLRMLHFYQENPDEAIDMKAFFPEEFKEYLLAQAEMAKLKEQQKIDPEGKEIPANVLSTLDARAFRSEVPFLTDLLDLGVAPKSKNTDTFEDKTDPVEIERQKRKMEERAEVLREAAMMGVELLSADENTANGRKTAGLRKNPNLLNERRIFIQDREGKEDLS
ncbi:MAG: DNA repair exonuclease [Planctomycetia bacterium]|nr:DNA repair exonuclease [Planctomycetia bacterium]